MERSTESFIGFLELQVFLLQCYAEAARIEESPSSTTAASTDTDTAPKSPETLNPKQ